MRPICINHGCNSGVSVMSGSIHDRNPRWRVHCGDCQKASYGAKPHKPGVTSFKTGKCSNTDGHLGFDCPINWEKIPSWATGTTEVDHIDGDSTNHSHNNLDELCPMCHKFKGQVQGDYNNQRKLGIAIPVDKHPVSVRHQYNTLFVS
jgi:hypothetical protein